MFLHFFAGYAMLIPTKTKWGVSMKLLIIRHGDPDYEKDSLTERGWREAELLAKRLEHMDIAAFYVSPLGRARDTASLTLKAMGRSAETLDWLREFPPHRMDADIGRQTPLWDWLPGTWTREPRFYDKEAWLRVPVMEQAGAAQAYRQVIEGLDGLLERHGYRRKENIYEAVRPNRDTIVLFCHFGLECVLLSHLIGASPMVLWHGTCAAPTSVTTVITEERRRGITSFRMSSFGDVTHLLQAGEEPSFSARFCETWDCASERHD